MTQKHEGDILETTNPSTGQRVVAKIEKIKRGFTRTLTHLLIAGQMLSLTPAHALQTSEGLWVQAGKLHGGDQLKTPQGIVTIDDACTETVEPTPVISYELENNLPYFVGQMPVLAAGTCDYETLLGILTDIDATVIPQFRNLLKSLGTSAELEEVLRGILKGFDLSQPLTNVEKRIIKNVAVAISDADNFKAWKILNESGATTLARDVTAINKVKTLSIRTNRYQLTTSQLSAITKYDDIKAIDLAQNLLSNTKVTNRQIIANFIKATKEVESSSLINKADIMDDMLRLTASNSIRNPDGIYTFITGLLSKQTKADLVVGPLYELEVALRKLNTSTDFEFSKNVPTIVSGRTKEVDILDFANGEIIEIKQYSAEAIQNMEDNMIDVGEQIGKIDPTVLNNFPNRIAQVRIKANPINTNPNPQWLNGSRSEIVTLLQDVRRNTQKDGILLDNATKYIIENNHPNSPFTILKSEWQ